MKKTCMRALCACAALLAGLAAGGAAARAQTLEEVREAAVPLRQTVEAYGRTIELDVEPEFPIADEMGVFVATFAWEEARTGVAVDVDPPPKRRGIVYRRKPRETYTPDDLPQDCRAINHPLTAREAVDAAWEQLSPLVREAGGVTAAWSEMTVMQPYFLYDKKAGEWGEQAVPDEAGWYNLSYDVSLYGAPVLSGNPYVLDKEALFAQEDWWMRQDYTTSASANASVQAANGEIVLSARASLPHVTQALAERIDFAPLDSVYGTLLTLAREGRLREAQRLRLGYLAFAYGERTDDVLPWSDFYLLKPVWICEAEIYDSAEDEPYGMSDGFLWRQEETIVFDARTGEVIESARVESYP